MSTNPSHFIVTLWNGHGFIVEKYAGRGGNAVTDESQAFKFDTMRQADAAAEGYRRDFDHVEVEPVYLANI